MFAAEVRGTLDGLGELLAIAAYLAQLIAPNLILPLLVSKRCSANQKVVAVALDKTHRNHGLRAFGESHEILLLLGHKFSSFPHASPSQSTL